VAIADRGKVVGIADSIVGPMNHLEQGRAVIANARPLSVIVRWHGMLDEHTARPEVNKLVVGKLCASLIVQFLIHARLSP